MADVQGHVKRALAEIDRIAHGLNPTERHEYLGHLEDAVEDEYLLSADQLPDDELNADGAGA